MDWLLATPQLHSAFSSLGSLDGDTYVIGPDALSILEEINYKLTYEDQTLRNFRRAIGFGQNVRSDLIPLLENTNDSAVLDSVIRILVNLTVPVECLFSVDVMYRTEVGRHTIFELNKLLYTSKEAFTDPKSTKSVVEYMKHLLESEPKLSLQKCDQINNCLLLLRNILHIPETNVNLLMPSVHSQSVGSHQGSMQNAILWNLFIQSIDKLLLYLMTCPNRDFWGVTMVQLIALMYKDQHVSTLQKLLNLWVEASLSESSEDNESNTSPPKQGSGDSSPMLTSDPTSDSSDNGSNGHKNQSAEDRRQAMREEATEATLQEVSRKGHEYQNSMMCEVRVKKEKDNVGVNANGEDEQQSCRSAAKQCVVQIKVEAMDEIAEYSNDDSGDSTKNCDMNEDCGNAKYKEKTPEQKQPVDLSQNTAKELSKQKAIDASKFKAPTHKINAKSLSSMTNDMTGLQQIDAVKKLGQKVPHNGQLNLTKGKSSPQKRECQSSQSELSDCGYGTQFENQESISTSSNEDEGPQGKPQHQKPPCNSKQRSPPQRIVMAMVDKKELRRKKLVKRSKSSLINMKGLVQHTPTDEDISNLLKEFTVDFLLKGYSFLVGELHSQLLTNIKIPIDTSHFFWLVTYFLKFAAQLELDMEHINAVLTFDVISYLTYEGVSLCEQLELNARQEGSDLKPFMRRMHLVVTAIREFLQAIETYKKVTHLSDSDHLHLRRLQCQISSTEDLRCLFVLLLRRFDPSLHTKQYLQDLVVTNHILLLILDFVTQTEGDTSIKLAAHIEQFATIEIMTYYGMLLEDFNNNGPFVNDCIFTMMHHVAGDLGQINTLFQPIILKTFSLIWEADYQLCDDWSDLIEYVIHKFINTPQKSSLSLPTASLTELTKEHNLENTGCSWTQEEMDTLYWYYVQSKKSSDVVGKIVLLFRNNGNKQKSRISIIQQLLQQDIITLVEYDDLMKFEDAEYQRTLLTTPTPASSESGIEVKTPPHFAIPSDDIQILRDLIIKENKEMHLVWLQKILLECVYIKLILKDLAEREDRQDLQYVMEPVAYHYILKNKSIPVVQWNSEQATTMLYQPFVLLLHKLGFQLPADAGSVFPRIPDFWTAEMMFGLARKLGPLDNLLIKFEKSQFEDANAIELKQLCQHAIAARESLQSLSNLNMEIGGFDENITLVSGMDIRNYNGNGNGNGNGSRNAMSNRNGTVSGRSNGGRRRSSANGNMLATVPEVDVNLENTNASASNNIFAVPKAKPCNSMIRYTPEPAPLPPLPNWLQLVMRNKINTNGTASLDNKNDGDKTTAAATENVSTTSTTLLSAFVTTAIATTATISTSTNDIGETSTMAAVALLPTTTTIQIPADQCPSEQNIIGLNSECNDNNNGTNNNTNELSTCTNGSTNNNKSSTAPATTITTTQLGVNIRPATMSSVTTTAMTAAAAAAVATTDNFIIYQKEQQQMQKQHHHQQKQLQAKQQHHQRKLQQQQQQQIDVALKTFERSEQQQKPSIEVNSPGGIPLVVIDDANIGGGGVADAGVITSSLSVVDMLSMVVSEPPPIGTFAGIHHCLDSDYCAIVETVYENDTAFSDCASVASDLTRMYVSDEEDKNVFPVTNFN